MSRPSSLTMWTSTDDCFCQEHVRQSLSPYSSKPQRRSSSAGIGSKSSSGRGGAVAMKHLLQRVAAETEPERLERNHLVGRNVPEVDRRTEFLDEPGLRCLRRRLPDEVVDVDRVRDLVD